MFFVLTRPSSDYEALTTQLILLACIPLVWWIIKFFVHCQFSDFIFQRNPRIVAIFRNLTIYFAAFAMLSCLFLKVITSLSEGGLDDPMPVALFFTAAALFYFSLLSRSTSRAQSA